MQSSEQLERMANPVCQVLLTEKELELPAVQRDFATGAMVEFHGVVRGLEAGREISGIDYEAHWTMAQHQLTKIGEQAAAQFALHQVTIHHRVGFVPAGESSLLLRVAARHRAKAFEASQWIVDELKTKAAIWKHPKFTAHDALSKRTRKDSA
jgi:molybdopterin synthase catalytic subunit